MYRFFVDERENNHFVLSEDLLKHIMVLRIRDEKFICIFEEVFYVCKLEKKRAIIIEKMNDLNEYKNQVILCPTLINIKRFEWLIQKSAELGVTRIIPIFSKNMNIKYKDISGKKIIRWREISKNACEQSFRNKIMSVEEPIYFEQAIKINAKYKIIAHEKSNSKKVNSLSDDIVILVGPEGGFTEDEIVLAKNNGFDIVNLGRRILRAETSSIFLLSIIK